MNLYQQFKSECASEIAEQGNDQALQNLTRQWMNQANARKYSYHFEWMGRPVIQYPADIVAVQEIVWNVRPDLIIETGIAHGGSLILSASLLAMLDMCDAIESGATNMIPGQSGRRVLGIDIDIRAHNRAAIEAHPMASRIQMIQGSSIAPEIAREVQDIAKDFERILVFLDSNHTHEHVAAELELYAPLTSKGSYCVVFDTVIEDMPKELFKDRPWGPGDNPKTAVWEYVKTHPNFVIDHAMHKKLVTTVAPDGFLKRIE